MKNFDLRMIILYLYIWKKTKLSRKVDQTMLLVFKSILFNWQRESLFFLMIQVPLITHNHNSPVVGFVVVWVSTTLSLRHWLSNGSTTETIAENVSTSPPADRLFLLAAAGESVGVSPPSAGGSEGGVSPPSAGGSEGGVSPPSAGGSEGGVSPPSGATVATPSATAGATPSSGIVSLSPHL